MKYPLKRTQLPSCYGDYNYEDCRLCLAVIECIYQTTGKSRRAIQEIAAVLGKSETNIRRYLKQWVLIKYFQD